MGTRSKSLGRQSVPPNLRGLSEATSNLKCASRPLPCAGAVNAKASNVGQSHAGAVEIWHRGLGRKSVTRQSPRNMNLCGARVWIEPELGRGACGTKSVVLVFATFVAAHHVAAKSSFLLHPRRVTLPPCPELVLAPNISRYRTVDLSSRSNTDRFAEITVHGKLGCDVQEVQSMRWLSVRPRTTTSALGGVHDEINKTVKRGR